MRLVLKVTEGAEVRNHLQLSAVATTDHTVRRSGAVSSSLPLAPLLVEVTDVSGQRRRRYAESTPSITKQRTEGGFEAQR